MPPKRLEIVEYPDPRLSDPSIPVAPEEIPELQGFIRDMFYTMFAEQGVGLAAPQVGRNIRIFVVDQQPINGDAEADPWVFINPVIEPLTEKTMVRREGCLSFPGMWVDVGRPEWVKITALDINGEEFSIDTTGSGLLSQAVQHEKDHLDGVIMSDKINKRGQRAFREWVKRRSGD